VFTLKNISQQRNNFMEISKKELESLGVEFVKTPEQPVHAGHFALPPDFPRDKFAAEWVPNDQVKLKEQKFLMPGVGATCPGLTVYRGESGKEKAREVYGVGDKKYTLMVRPKRLQEVMNALYGNLGKAFYNREVKGETIAGQRPEDSGMLPVSKLSEFGSQQEVEESLVELNKVDREPAEAAAVAT
jgi:hypothetical protein